MADKRAQELIRLYDRHWRMNSNFRSLWQETADFEFPRESSITETLVRGAKRNDKIYDTTAIVDSKEMADGLLSALIPAGEYFFQLNPSKDNFFPVNNEYIEWCARATDKLHRDLFASNFMQQMGETMRSLIVFGTGNIYSEWSMNVLGLNFRDYDIAVYVIWENEDGNIEGCGLCVPYTARQAYDRWGDKAGPLVKKANEKPEDAENIFEFIHTVRPRKERNLNKGGILNSQYESVWVNKKEELIVQESGYYDFCYHIPRWMKTSGEVMGRGVGTEILPQVKVLNRAMWDFIELCNKHVNPPLEVLESFDGDVDMTPLAANVVTQIPSIKAIDRDMRGNFPVAEKEILTLRDFIHKAFYKDVFWPISDLKGDRRTQLEIMQRKREGLTRMGQPSGRIQSELLEPLLRRCLRLEIAHGQIPQPPAGLDFLDIEYLGLMSNALSSGQSTAFQRWMAVGVELEERHPGVLDNVDIDEGFRHLGRSLGVKAEHINPPEMRDKIRKQRQQQAEAQRQAELAQMAGQAYGQATAAPEQGSPAEALMEAANA